ncbi:MAG: DUF6172 family protein [Terrimicrobiaceae bacterium]
MKKIFPFHVPGREDLKVLESIKIDVSKYVKRERRKVLPEGVDFWDFRCRIGPDREAPADTHLAGVPKAIDAVAQSGAPEVYVEILACSGLRTKKPAAAFPGDQP